jgi:hypothetical protein
MKKYLELNKRRNYRMKIRLLTAITVLALFVFVVGCKEEKRFTPPEDGKVTKKMAERYVKVSVALTELAENETVKLAEFREKHEISSGMSELNDEEYKEKYPEVAADWDSILSEWNRKKDSVHEALGMSEEEWDWIAGAIISHKNMEMRDFIREEFDRIKGEKDSLPTQPTDSN